MRILEGIAVSPGVAIGEAFVLDIRGWHVPSRLIAPEDVPQELARLDAAIEAAVADIEINRQDVSQRLGSQYGAIFAAHQQMLRDPKLRTELRALIEQGQHGAEYAVRTTLRRYAQILQSLDSRYLAERANDVDDIERTLLRRLMGRGSADLAALEKPTVVLAHNLTPNETARLNRQSVLGFVTEAGGLGGHTSIVAEALGIPAVVGAGPFLDQADSGEVVIVDGHRGLVIFRPDAATVEQYRDALERRRTRSTALAALGAAPAETADGARIHLAANIEFPYEIDLCQECGADGIGLYRTEFLYLTGPEEPDEQAHFQAYARAATQLAGKPVVIRTLDLGADKLYTDTAEKNPFLGLRSIRLSLRRPEVFRAQLRAVLRASACGDVRLMFPLISTLDELRQAKAHVEQVKRELAAAGAPFNERLPIGMMVETPAAVVLLDRFAAEVDFFSIGTNDLIQYSLAVDRGNPDVSHLYQACDPSVLRLIALAVRDAQRAGAPISLCGQMGGSALLAPLLLGLGLRSLSVAPSVLLEVKQVIRQVTLEDCDAIAHQALELSSAAEIEQLVRGRLQGIAPELALR